MAIRCANERRRESGVRAHLRPLVLLLPFTKELSKSVDRPDVDDSVKMIRACDEEVVRDSNESSEGRSIALLEDEEQDIPRQSTGERNDLEGDREVRIISWGPEKELSGLTFDRGSSASTRFSGAEDDAAKKRRNGEEEMLSSTVCFLLSLLLRAILEREVSNKHSPAKGPHMSSPVESSKAGRSSNHIKSAEKIREEGRSGQRRLRRYDEPTTRT